MRRIRPLLRTRHRMRALILTSTLGVTSACTDRDTLPTMPPIAAPSAPSAAIVGADVTSLGFEVAAINDAGQVAGTLNGRAVLWTPTQGTLDLGTLGGPSSRAYAINVSGQVAGSSTTTTGQTHAFVWTPGVGMQDLGALGNSPASAARGMNDLGQVVGEIAFPPCGACQQPEKHAFLWTPDQGMQDLGTLPGLASTIAYDINNAGQVVGRAFSANAQIFPPTDPEYLSRAFLWAPGQGMRDLGDLGGGHSIAYAINDAGQVVGRSWLSTYIEDYGLPYRAFLWTSDQGMRNLGSVAAVPSASAAYGINESGQVVGMTDTGPYFLGYGPLQGFLWTAANGMDAITPTTGIRTARGINDRQQVIGDGRVVTVQLAPSNNPPVALPGGPYSGVEGSPVALTLSATDIDDVGFFFKVSFGDGSEEWFWPTLPVRQHTYADNGTYTLTLTAFDVRGRGDTKTTTVTIANVAPTILPGSLTGPTAPIPMTGGSASAPIALAFMDPGRFDRHAAEIQCGNGATLSPNGITSPYTATCPYTSPGVYTVLATVADEDGGTSAPAAFRYVVVYDPKGGSIAGSGFYTVDNHGNRKAHFTFNAGFDPGDPAVPNGRARFWIPGERFDFESTSLEMLVVAGDWAQLWGTGNLNGLPARFRITAVDGPGRAGNAGDAFRIELWQADALVFDTQPGAARDAPVITKLEGGSIRIQRD